MPKDRGIQLNDNTSTGQILDLKVEIKKDAEGKITQGLVVGDTLNQNQALILINQPGENKFNPQIGVGIADVLLSHDYLGYRHKIRNQYNLDGLRIKRLDLYNNKPLVIDASY